MCDSEMWYFMSNQVNLLKEKNEHYVQEFIQCETKFIWL